MLTILFICGCEKDNVVTLPFYNLEPGAELLQYMESKGDYVNNNLVPLISADELYQAADSVLIIDLRKEADYLNGHINGAINIPSSLLYDTLRALNTDNKIVLVSATGELSAYDALLLRIAGFSNVFTLNFGMASWNGDFADVWLTRIVNLPFSLLFSTEDYFKTHQFQLPDPALEGNSIEAKLNNKIKKLLSTGFSEKHDSVNIGSIEFNEIEDIDPYYIVCAGPAALYYSKLYGTYHLRGAVNYLLYPYISQFRSTNDLQTLPDKQKILVYSGSGQESAFITAYLHLLGYDAYSLLLGCNSFAYNMLSAGAEIRPYQFNPSAIRNYPYIK